MSMTLIEEIFVPTDADDLDENADQEAFINTIKNSNENKNKDAASRYMIEAGKTKLLTKGQEIIISQQIEYTKNSSLAFVLLFPSALESILLEYEKQNKHEKSHPKIAPYSQKNEDDNREPIKRERQKSSASEVLAIVTNIINDIQETSTKLVRQIDVDTITLMNKFFDSLNPLTLPQEQKQLIVQRLKKGMDQEFCAPFDFYSLKYANNEIFKSLPKAAQEYIVNIFRLTEYNVDNDYVKKLITIAKTHKLALADCKIRFMNLEKSANIKRSKLISHYYSSVDSFELKTLKTSDSNKRKLALLDYDLEKLAITAGLKPLIIESLWNVTFKYSQKTIFSIQDMCKANLLLVIHVAKRYKCHAVEFMDFVQEGNIGLQRAVEKFDYRMGNKFSTYGTHWIRQAITRCINDQRTQIRIPAHMQELIKKIDKFTKEYATKHTSLPSENEIAKELGVDVDKIKLAVGAQRDPISLHSAPSSNTSDEPSTSLLSLIEYDDEGTVGSCPSTSYELGERRDVLLSMLKTLPVRDAKIIMMRFGFEVSHEHTLEEAGKQFNVTRERIRQLEKKGCEKLTDLTKNDRLADYI